MCVRGVGYNGGGYVCEVSIVEELSIKAVVQDYMGSELVGVGCVVAGVDGTNVGR